MTMLQEIYKRLIEKLIDATKNKTIRWSESSLINKYDVKIDTYTISIYLVPDDGAFQVLMPFTKVAELDFIDETGNTFDSISVVHGQEKDDSYTYLVELHEVAKRSAGDIDIKLDKILNALS
jgi:hypothetical protein